MEKKGTILIVDDLIEGKIGRFEEMIKSQGYSVEFSETYEDARNKLGKLISSNKIDGLILDFSFPINDNDKSTTINDIPCGVQLLKDFLFNISLMKIPVVINTTGEEDCKNRYLKSIDCSDAIIYDIKTLTTSLSEPTLDMSKQIFKLFSDRYERRVVELGIKKDSSILGTGKSVIKNRNGDYCYSKYNGD